MLQQFNHSAINHPRITIDVSRLTITFEPIFLQLNKDIK